jgi:hypothetical protein
VRLPLFGADDSQFIQFHQDSLQLCDAVLAYCGTANEIWLPLKRQELVDKIRVQERERHKPMLAKGFYLSAPSTSGKERFRTHEGIVIKNYGPFNPDSLNPFLDRIR